MPQERLLHGLAVFTSSYVKRLMEANYDSLMRTGPAKKLMEAGAPTRYGVEAALYALLAYAEQHWEAGTPFRALIREVAMDAPAEISKRLVNGFRAEVLANADRNAQDKPAGVEEVLSGLDDETLAAVLAWVAQRRTGKPSSDCPAAANVPEDATESSRGAEPKGSTASRTPRRSEAKPPSKLARAIREEIERAHRRVDDQRAALRDRDAG